LRDVVARCCEIKADVVGQDETESGLRAILNFGHTIGHATSRTARAIWKVFTTARTIAIGQVAESELSQKVFEPVLPDRGAN